MNLDLFHMLDIDFLSLKIFGIANSLCKYILTSLLTTWVCEFIEVGNIPQRYIASPPLPGLYFKQSCSCICAVLAILQESCAFQDWGCWLRAG